MKDIESTLKKTTRWLSKGVDLEFIVTAHVDDFELSRITEALAGAVFGTATYNEGKPERLLVNTKGQSGGSDVEEIPENEVLFYSGEVATEERAGDYEWEPCNLSVSAILAEFTDALRYRLEVHREGALSKDVPPTALSRVINLRPREIRLTMESLRLSFVSNLVGSGPRPTHRFKCLANERTFHLTVIMESWKQQTDTPFESEPLLKTLSTALTPILGNSLRELFMTPTNNLS